MDINVQALLERFVDIGTPILIAAAIAAVTQLARKWGVDLKLMQDALANNAADTGILAAEEFKARSKADLTDADVQEYAENVAASVHKFPSTAKLQNTVQARLVATGLGAAATKLAEKAGKAEPSRP